jgi:DNA excision repair protein ERCC-4
VVKDASKKSLADRPVVLIDSREQAPLRFSNRVGVEVVTLPVGDYSLRGATELVAIERKRLGELATCCGVERDRFLEQIERQRAYPVRALVIECDADGILGHAYRSEIHPLSVLGTLIKFSSDWQIPVWFAGDARNAALIVERMLCRVAKQVPAKDAAKGCPYGFADCDGCRRLNESRR